MSTGVKLLMEDNTAQRESKAHLKERCKELKRSSVPRHIHDKILKEVLEQNKELKQDVRSLSVQIETRDSENEKSGEKVSELRKKVNRLRMLSARKDRTMEHKQLAAEVALNELRLDKEASDTYYQHTYYQQVLQLLQHGIQYERVPEWRKVLDVQPSLIQVAEWTVFLTDKARQLCS